MIDENEYENEGDKETAPFGDRLAERVRLRRTPVLVGLDPRLDQLPAAVVSGDGPSASLLTGATSFREFCHGVIDAVADLVPAVKPQAAFFEQLGPPGMQALYDLVQYARHAGLIVILDGKRNDIGSTAQAYAHAYLGADSPWGADALTVSPYLGDDSLEPFHRVAVERQAGVFVLVKTSNPGGGMLQDQRARDCAIYERVADHVEQLAAASAGDCGYGATGAVVGATYPTQLAELRQRMPSAWLLVPGFGAQGGAAADVAGGFDAGGLGAVINSSRAIIFAHRRPEFERFGEENWQDAVRAATQLMIDQLRDKTPAGRL